MKKHLKFLLGLALIVLIFGGCQNPSGSETPEVNEPVVETPEDNSNKTKVEFRWGEYLNVGGYCSKPIAYISNYTRYLSGLHFDSEWNSYVYDYPEGYDRVSYKEVRNDEERLKEFSEDVFENVFGTKYYKEGTVIDLKKWTSEAIDLLGVNEEVITYTNLYFLAEDVGYDYKDIKIKSFDEIVVGNKDIVVYVYFMYDTIEREYQ